MFFNLFRKDLQKWDDWIQQLNHFQGSMWGAKLLSKEGGDLKATSFILALSLVSP